MRKIFLLIPLLVLFIIGIIFLILVLIGVVLMIMFLTPPQSDIYSIAEEAPQDANMVAYADLKSLAEKESVLETIGAPDISPLHNLLGYGGVIATDNATIFVINGRFFDFIAANAPTITGIAGSFTEMPEVEKKEYHGTTIYETGDMTYYVKNGMIFLAEKMEMRRFIKTKEGSAADKFESVISQIETDEIMLAMKQGEEKIAFSAHIIGENAIIKGIIETKSPENAQGYKLLLENVKIDGMTLKTAYTNGKFLHVKMDVEIEKIDALLSGMPSTNQPNNPEQPSNPVQPIRPLPNNTEIPELPEEPEDVPCSTQEECMTYCAQNPDECEDLLEQYTKNPCCQECITQYGLAGYGLENIGMQCSEFTLSSECQEYFQETPHAIIDCYDG